MWISYITQSTDIDLNIIQYLESRSFVFQFKMWGIPQPKIAVNIKILFYELFFFSIIKEINGGISCFAQRGHAENSSGSDDEAEMRTHLWNTLGDTFVFGFQNRNGK